MAMWVVRGVRARDFAWRWVLDEARGEFVRTQSFPPEIARRFLRTFMAQLIRAVR